MRFAILSLALCLSLPAFAQGPGGGPGGGGPGGAGPKPEGEVLWVLVTSANNPNAPPGQRRIQADAKFVAMVFGTADDIFDFKATLELFHVPENPNQQDTFIAGSSTVPFPLDGDDPPFNWRLDTAAYGPPGSYFAKAVISASPHNTDSWVVLDREYDTPTFSW